MLDPQDAKVAASDAEIPALRLFLDDDAALDVFQEYCPELKPTAARCTYLRYKPGTSCLAAYSLKTLDGERLFHAKAYTRGNQVKIDKVLDRNKRLSGVENLSFAVRKLQTVFTPFPHDDKLPALELLINKPAHSLLSRIVPELSDLHKAHLAPLHYKPERRFVARLDVNGSPAAVLKVHADARYRQARRGMKSLGSPRELGTACALGHSDRHRALIASWLAGTSLSRLLETRLATCSNLAAAGKVLANLHNLRLKKLPLRTIHDEMLEVMRQPLDFRYASEASAARLSCLTQACVMAMSSHLTTASVTHGDFHPGQLLIDLPNVSLIDLDDVAIGNTAYDLGNFIAHLEYATLTDVLKNSVKERFIKAFLEGYLQRSRCSAEHRSIQIYTAESLLRLIHEPFRHRVSHWHILQDKMLDRTDELLAQAAQPLAIKRRRDKRHQGIEVLDPLDACNDRKLPFLIEATNCDLASQRIGTVAKQVYDDASLELRSIRVVRHKPGRRCLVEYRFHRHAEHSNLVLLGKIHAKKRHERSYRLQQSLWRHGFDDQSIDGISVARPVGVVSQWNMWLQEYVPGKDGWEAILGEHGATATSQIATAANKLHGTNLQIKREHTIDDELQIIEQKLPLVVRQIPALKPRIESVLAACRELVCRLPARPLCGIHRDFYPEQVLFAANRIYLLDLDLYCYGNPILDIGNFCAHLIERGVRNLENTSLLESARQQVVDRYTGLNHHACRQAISRYTTLSLVRHIYLATLFPAREPFLASILSTCEERLSRHFELAATSCARNDTHR